MTTYIEIKEGITKLIKQYTRATPQHMKGVGFTSAVQEVCNALNMLEGTVPGSERYTVEYHREPFNMPGGKEKKGECIEDIVCERLGGTRDLRVFENDFNPTKFRAFIQCALGISPNYAKHLASFYEEHVYNKVREESNRLSKD